MTNVARDKKLTEMEGRVLSIIARLEAPTTYMVYAVLNASPTSSIHASKGTVYPIVARLLDRGYVESTPIADNGNGAELLKVTDAGVEAVRRWTADIADAHILPYDPLRVRIPTLQFLSREERLEWIARAKKLNQQKVDEADAYKAQVEMAYVSVAHLAAVTALAAQSKWLDKLLIDVIDQGAEEGPTRVSHPMRP